MPTPILSTDILDALVDEDGDIALSAETGWRVPWAIGAVGIKQLILIALRLFFGEWFLNMTIGVPWFQEILGQKYDEKLLRQRCAEAISRVSGVNTITKLVCSFDGSTRMASVEYEVVTTFGDTVADALSFVVGK